MGLDQPYRQGFQKFCSSKIDNDKKSDFEHTMPAEKVGAATMLARIVEMVAQTQRSRAPIQRLAD